MGAPLEGIVVLDLPRLLPGPFACQLLRNLGAEVIKVEEPEIGDYMRFVPPIVRGTSYPFLMVNRGKRSLAVDLKRAGGAVARADDAHGSLPVLRSLRDPGRPLDRRRGGRTEVLDASVRSPGPVGVRGPPVRPGRNRGHRAHARRSIPHAHAAGVGDAVPRGTAPDRLGPSGVGGRGGPPGAGAGTPPGGERARTRSHPSRRPS